jgi:peptidoglycan/xylan/chitin deacetylase (PgdA/CDA1 family)
MTVNGPQLDRSGDRSPPRRRRYGRVAVLGTLALLGYLATSGADAIAASPTTIVSLTFDDGRASQSAALPILADHGMAGTFYLNSGRIGAGGFLTGSQVNDLAAAGHEIGGHTNLHEDLTVLSPSEASATVCEDRANLMARGFTVTSFADPFGATNASVKDVVEDCGYESARGVGGLVGPSCGQCPTAELLPPRDPWYVATPDSVKSSTTLSTLQASVDEARGNGGGWVPYVFHDVGTGGTLSISTSLFDQFLDWLAVQPDTEVRTVAGALGQPPSEPPPPSPQPLNVVRNPSLEAGGQLPTCFFRAGYGANTYTWTRSSDAHSGSASQRVDIHSHSSGDRKLVPLLDTGQAAGGCAPNVTPGASYNLSVRYKANRAVYLVSYYRSSTGTWLYWETSDGQPSTSSWRTASWTTAPVPRGATAVSFGLALTQVGSLTVDDFSMSAK